MKSIVLFCAFSFCVFGQTVKSPAVPENLRPPADQLLIVQAHGVGDQIYSCQNAGSGYGWVLKAPDAQLLSPDQQVVGHHFAGPTWEWKDKSAVVGKVASSTPSPEGDSVPWLLLNVVVHQGNGALSSITTIQRLNTKGGKAQKAGCDGSHMGEEKRVHYEADYLFYGK
jgi:hypothetical protein